jgi:hypothetical protein
MRFADNKGFRMCTTIGQIESSLKLLFTRTWRVDRWNDEGMRGQEIGYSARW